MAPDRCQENVFTYTKSLLGLLLRPSKTAHHRLPLHTPPRMALRIKERLTVPHVHPRSLFKIIHRQLIKVLLLHQHLKPTIVNLKEREALLIVIDTMPRAGLDDVV